MPHWSLELVVLKGLGPHYFEGQYIFRKGDEMASLQSGSWPHLILGFKPGKPLNHH